MQQIEQHLSEAGASALIVCRGSALQANELDAFEARAHVHQGSHLKSVAVQEHKAALGVALHGVSGWSNASTVQAAAMPQAVRLPDMPSHARRVTPWVVPATAAAAIPGHGGESMKPRGRAQHAQRAQRTLASPSALIMISPLARQCAVCRWERPVLACEGRAGAGVCGGVG